MVTVENDTWAACVVIPDQVIKVAVGLNAETEVGLRREVREEVLEGQTRYRNTVFKHIDLSLLPELTHFFDRLQERYHMQILYQTRKSLKVDISFSSHTC